MTRAEYRPKQASDAEAGVLLSDRASSLKNEFNLTPTSKNMHFGVGRENYAHFTSPIRRFADILVHIALKDKFIRKSLDQNSENSLDLNFSQSLNKYGTSFEAILLTPDIYEHISDRSMSQRRLEINLRKIYAVADFYQDGGQSYESEAILLDIGPRILTLGIQSGALEGIYKFDYDGYQFIKCEMVEKLEPTADFSDSNYSPKSDSENDPPAKNEPKRSPSKHCAIGLTNQEGTLTVQKYQRYDKLKVLVSPTKLYDPEEILASDIENIDKVLIDDHNIDTSIRYNQKSLPGIVSTKYFDLDFFE